MSFRGYFDCFMRKIASYLTIKRMEIDRKVTQSIDENQSKKRFVEIQNGFFLVV